MKLNHKKKRNILKPKYTDMITKLTKKNTKYNTGYKNVNIIYDNRLYFVNDNSKDEKKEMVGCTENTSFVINNTNVQEKCEMSYGLEMECETGDVKDTKKNECSVDMHKNEIDEIFDAAIIITQKDDRHEEEINMKETRTNENVNSYCREENADSHIVEVNQQIDVKIQDDKNIEGKIKENSAEENMAKGSTKINVIESIENKIDSGSKNSGNAHDKNVYLKIKIADDQNNAINTGKGKRVTFHDKQFTANIPPDYSNIIHTNHVPESESTKKKKDVVVKRIFRRCENDLDLQFVFTTKNK